jgi:Tfp pilus assembly protein PilF
MSLVSRHATRSPLASGVRRRAARGAALLALGMTAVALSGCAVHVLGHRIGLPARADRPRATGLQAQVLDLREQATLAPREPYWPYQIARAYLGADSIAPAEAALRASLALQRTYAPSLALLSKLYFETGRHTEAVAALEPVRSQPGAFANDVRQVLLAGLALHEDALGRTGAAGDAIARIPRGDLKAAAPAAVYIALRSDHPGTADSLAAAAVRDDPRSAANQNNFGITRLHAGDPVAARRAFMAAIRLDSKLPGPYYNLAILEKYYALDDAAASHWFASYWERSQADPDSLLGVFANGGKNLVVRGN